MRQIKNQWGNSLLQVVVSMGLASMISLGLTYAFVTSMDGMSHLKNMSLAEDATAFLGGLLADSNYCGLHFNGMTVPNTMGTVLKTDIAFNDMVSATALGTNKVFATGEKFQGTLNIDSISLTVDSKIGDARYVGSVVANFSVPNGLLSKFQRKLPIFIEKDAANKISGCGKTASSITVSTTYVKGMGYGSCLQLKDANWNIGYGGYKAWPIISCPSSGGASDPASTPTCDTGFTLAVIHHAQTNTFHSGAVNGVPVGGSAAADLRNVIGAMVDADAYSVSYNCIKN